MKKLLGLLVILATFTLTGCDMFEDNNNYNVWYDEGNQTLHLDYSLPKPKEDETTGEVPVETILLMGRYKEDDWFLIQELTSYSASDLQIPFQPDQYGDLEIQLVRSSETGESVFTSVTFYIYINEPQFLYHFDVHFDSWNGVVNFNLGVNEMLVKSVAIHKSTDGGLTWTEVLQEEIEFNEEEGFKGYFNYYEYEENNYVYKVTCFDEAGEEVYEQSSWNEIMVKYENHNFEGAPHIDYLGYNYDLYSRNVNLWWNAYGDFEEVRIEKSLDQETWIEVALVPRFVQSYNFQEDTDGSYYYRISALIENEVQVEFVSEDALRVSDDAFIGHLDAWIDWETSNIQINWYFQTDQVQDVVLERSFNEEEYTEVGTFGNLKQAYTDESLPEGFYKYRITILDETGEVLDQAETKELEIQAPEHVYHVNGWFDQGAGQVHFNFGFNQNYVSYYTIFKSNDGGLNWEEYITNDVELTDGWYKDHFSVYELEEGVYAYKLVGYNNENEVMGETYSYNETVVDYTNLNLDEPTQFHYLDGNFNIWDQTVNLWWGSQGMYESHLVQVSLDGEIWEDIALLPRVVTYTSFDLPTEGDYYFRISALDSDNNALATMTSEKTVYVRENALIGNVNVWFNYDNQVHVGWDIITDNVGTIKVYRTDQEQGVTELLGAYGSLKTTILDELTTASTYYYTVQVFDADGNLLDQLDSQPIEVYIYA